MNTKTFKRGIALITAACLLISSPGGGTGWASASPGDARLSAELSGLFLPSATARITEADRRDSDVLIVNIQDLHCHAEAQRKISEILGALDRHQRLDTVYVEGNIGRQDTSWVDSFKDKTVRRSAVDALLASGKLTGPEYFSITSKRPRLLYGIEETRPYLENLRRLYRIMKDEPHSRAQLSAGAKTLAQLTAAYYGPRNRRISKWIKGHDSGSLESSKFYRLLFRTAEEQGIDTRRFPNVAGYLRISELQRGIDYRAVGRQMGMAAEVLKTQLPYRDYEQLVASANDPAGAERFYVLLGERLRKDGSLAGRGWKELEHFLDFLGRNRRLNPFALIREEKRLVMEIRQQYAGSRAERDAAFLDGYWSYLEEFAAGKIPSDDYAYLYGRRGHFRETWSRYMAVPLPEKWFSLQDDYYRTNLERNSYFLKAVFPDAPQSLTDAEPPALRLSNDPAAECAGALVRAKTVIVMVTGGFHTQGLAQLARRHGYSFAVITPSVAGDVEPSEQIFRSLALAQGGALSQALRVMSNWQALQFASQEQYAAVAAQAIDGTLLDALVKGGYRRGDIEREISGLLREVSSRPEVPFKPGTIGFFLVSERASFAGQNEYEYAITIDGTRYRFSAYKDAVTPLDSTAIQPGVQAEGKGVIPWFKWAFMKYVVLKAPRTNRPGLESFYDNILAPVAEELVFAGAAGLFGPHALILARAAFAVLHLWQVTPEGRPVFAGFSWRTLAVPLLVAAAGGALMAFTGNVGWSILAHVMANAVLVPALSRAGITVGKAVIGDTAGDAVRERTIIDYYGARLAMVHAFGSRDAAQYGQARADYIAAANRVRSALDGAMATAADYRTTAAELRKTGKLDSFVLTDAAGKAVLGPDDEILQAAGGTFSPSQQRWIEESVEDIIAALQAAFPRNQQLNPDKLRQLLQTNIYPLSAELLLFTEREAENIWASVEPSKYQSLFAGQLLGLVAPETGGFAHVSRPVPSIALRPVPERDITDPVKDRSWFRSIAIHEMIHFLSAKGILPIPAQLEMVTHAVTSAEAGQYLPGLHEIMTREGKEWGAQHQGQPVDQLTFDELMQGAHKVFIDHWQEAGLPSLQAALNLNRLMAMGVIDTETVQRFIGSFLGGAILGVRAGAAGRSEVEVLADILRWADTVMAAQTRGVPQFPVNPLQRRTLIDRITGQLRDITGDDRLMLVEQADPHPATAFTLSEDGHTLFYDPTYLDHPDPEIAASLFLEQAFLLKYGNPGMVEPELRTSRFMSLYSAAELARIRRQAAARRPALEKSFTALDEVLYPNTDSEAVRNRTASLPLFVQFIEGVLFEGRTGHREQRVTNKLVRAALKETRGARNAAYAARDARSAYLALKEVMGSKAVRRLIEQSEQEEAKALLERQLAEKRALETAREREALQKQAQEMWDSLTPEEQRDLMDEANRRLRKEMQDMLGGMSGAGQQSAQQLSRQEAAEEAADSMGERTRMAGERAQSISDELQELNQMIGGAQQQTDNLHGKAGDLQEQTGKRPVTGGQVQQLSDALDAITRAAKELRREIDDMKQDTEALRKSGQGMDPGAAPSAGEMGRSSGELDKTAGELEQAVSGAQKTIEQLEKDIAGLENQLRQQPDNTIGQRGATTAIQDDTGKLQQQINDMQKQVGKANEQLQAVGSAIERTKQELREHRSRLEQEQADGSGAPGKQGSEELLAQAESLAREAERELQQGAGEQGGEQGKEGRESALDKARELARRAQETAAQAGSRSGGQADPRLQEALDKAAEQMGQGSSEADALKDMARSLKDAADRARRARGTKQSPQAPQADQTTGDKGGQEQSGEQAPQPPPMSSGAANKFKKLAQAAKGEQAKPVAAGVVKDETAGLKGTMLNAAEEREKQVLFDELLDNANWLRRRLKKLLQETAINQDMTNLTSGDLDEENLTAVKTGRAQKRTMLPGQVSHRIVLVMDTSGSMGTYSNPEYSMYYAIRAAVSLMLAARGLDGVEIGIVVYGNNEASRLLLPLQSVRGLDEDTIFRIYKDKLCPARGSTEDIPTLRSVPELIGKDAAPETQKTVIHITDGNPDAPADFESQVQQLYKDTEPDQIKWATWVFRPRRARQMDEEQYVSRYRPDGELAGDFAKGLEPVAYAGKGATFLEEIAGFVNEVFETRRPFGSFGERTLEALSWALATAAPYFKFVQNTCSRLLGVASAAELQYDAILAQARASTDIADALLRLVFKGENDRFLKTEEEARREYAGLLQDVPANTVRISKSPLKNIRSRDQYILATWDNAEVQGARVVIIHELLARALAGRKDGRELLALIVRHEAEEAQFIAASLAARTFDELKARYGELTREQYDFLKKHPARAYEAFHALTAAEYAPIFSLAQEIAAEKTNSQLGYVQKNGKTCLRISTPEHPEALDIEVDDRTNNPRVIQLYVQRAGQWVPVTPASLQGPLPDVIAFRFGQSARYEQVKLTPQNLNVLYSMLQVYNNLEAANSNLGLIGPRGTGKNTLGFAVAAMLGVPVRIVSLHANITQQDLRERPTIIQSVKHARIQLPDGSWTSVEIPSTMTQAVASEIYAAAEADDGKGELVIIDEVDKVKLASVLSGINSLLTRNERKRRIGPRFRVMAFANDHQGDDVQGQDLTVGAGDFVDRFTWLSMGYLPENEEIDHVMQSVNGDLEDGEFKENMLAAVTFAVKIANEIRQDVARKKLSRTLSTRGVIRIARHLRAFPEDINYFRTVFDKAYGTGTLEKQSERDRITEILAKYDLADGAYPEDFDVGSFKYTVENGVVYCSLGSGPNLVRVRTGLKPGEKDEAEKRLEDHLHTRFNMIKFWQWMKDISLGNNIMVLGVPGTGKTVFSDYLVNTVLGLNSGYKVLDTSTRGNDILGSWGIDKDVLKFTPGDVPICMKEGRPCILDEIDKPEPTVNSSLNGVGQHGIVTAPDHEVYEGKPGFFLFALGNLNFTGNTTSHKVSGEVMDRFSVYVEDKLDKDQIAEILTRYAQKRQRMAQEAGRTWYPVSPEFIAALAEFQERLGEQERKVGRRPSMRVAQRVIDKVGEDWGAYFDIAATYQTAFMNEERRLNDNVGSLSGELVDRPAIAKVSKARQASFAQISREAWVRSAGRSKGQAFDTPFIFKYLAVIASVDNLIVQKRVPRQAPLDPGFLNRLLLKIAAEGGSVIWQEGYDEELNPALRTIVDELAEAVEALEGHRKQIEAICKEKFPELNFVKRVADSRKKITAAAAAFETETAGLILDGIPPSAQADADELAAHRERLKAIRTRGEELGQKRIPAKNDAEEAEKLAAEADTLPALARELVVKIRAAIARANQGDIPALVQRIMDILRELGYDAEQRETPAAASEMPVSPVDWDNSNAGSVKDEALFDLDAINAELRNNGIPADAVTTLHAPSMHPSGRYMAVAVHVGDRDVTVLTDGNGKDPRLLQVRHTVPHAHIMSVQFSPDGRHLVYVLRPWGSNTDAGSEIELHRFAPDDAEILSLKEDAGLSAKKWLTYNKDVLAIVISKIYAISFSPDGTKAAVAMKAGVSKDEERDLVLVFPWNKDDPRLLPQDKSFDYPVAMMLEPSGRVTTRFISDPIFSPDGEEIVQAVMEQEPGLLGVQRLEARAYDKDAREEGASATLIPGNIELPPGEDGINWMFSRVPIVYFPDGKHAAVTTTFKKKGSGGKTGVLLYDYDAADHKLTRPRVIWRGDAHVMKMSLTPSGDAILLFTDDGMHRLTLPLKQAAAAQEGSRRTDAREAQGQNGTILKALTEILGRLLSGLAGPAAAEAVEAAKQVLSEAEKASPSAETGLTSLAVTNRLTIETGTVLPGLPGPIEAVYNHDNKPLMSRGDGSRMVLHVEIDGKARLIYIDRDLQTGEVKSGILITEGQALANTITWSGHIDLREAAVSGDGRTVYITVYDGNAKHAVIIDRDDSGNVTVNRGETPDQFITRHPALNYDGTEMLLSFRANNGPALMRFARDRRGMGFVKKQDVFEYDQAGLTDITLDAYSADGSMVLGSGARGMDDQWLLQLTRQPNNDLKLKKVLKDGETIPGTEPGADLKWTGVSASWDIAPDGTAALLVTEFNNFARVLLVEFTPGTREISRVREILREGHVLKNDVTFVRTIYRNSQRFSSDGKRILCDVEADNKHKVLVFGREDATETAQPLLVAEEGMVMPGSQDVWRLESALVFGNKHGFEIMRNEREDRVVVEMIRPAQMSSAQSTPVDPEPLPMIDKLQGTPVSSWDELCKAAKDMASMRVEVKNMRLTYEGWMAGEQVTLDNQPWINKAIVLRGTDGHGKSEEVQLDGVSFETIRKMLALYSEFCWRYYRDPRVEIPDFVKYFKDRLPELKSNPDRVIEAFIREMAAEYGTPYKQGAPKPAKPVKPVAPPAPAEQPKETAAPAAQDPSAIAVAPFTLKEGVTIDGLPGPIEKIITKPLLSKDGSRIVAQVAIGGLNHLIAIRYDLQTGKAGSTVLAKQDRDNRNKDSLGWLLGGKLEGGEISGDGQTVYFKGSARGLVIHYEDDGPVTFAFAPQNGAAILNFDGTELLMQYTKSSLGSVQKPEERLIRYTQRARGETFREVQEIINVTKEKYSKLNLNSRGWSADGNTAVGMMFGEHQVQKGCLLLLKRSPDGTIAFNKIVEADGMLNADPRLSWREAHSVLEVSPDGTAALVCAHFGGERRLVLLELDPVSGAVTDARIVLDKNTKLTVSNRTGSENITVDINSISSLRFYDDNASFAVNTTVNGKPATIRIDRREGTAAPVELIAGEGTPVPGNDTPLSLRNNGATFAEYEYDKNYDFVSLTLRSIATHADLPVAGHASAGTAKEKMAALDAETAGTASRLIARFLAALLADLPALLAKAAPGAVSPEAIVELVKNTREVREAVEQAVAEGLPLTGNTARDAKLTGTIVRLMKTLVSFVNTPASPVPATGTNDWSAIDEAQGVPLVEVEPTSDIDLPIISPDGNWALVLVGTELTAYKRVNGRLTEPQPVYVAGMNTMRQKPVFYLDKATGKLMAFINVVVEGKTETWRYIFDSGIMYFVSAELGSYEAPQVMDIDEQGRYAVVKNVKEDRNAPQIEPENEFYIQQMQPDGALSGERRKIGLPADLAGLYCPPGYSLRGTRIHNAQIGQEGKYLYVLLSSLYYDAEGKYGGKYIQMVRYSLNDDLEAVFDGKVYPSREIEIGGKKQKINQLSGFSVSGSGQIFFRLEEGDWCVIDGDEIHILNIDTNEISMSPDRTEIFYRTDTHIMGLDIPKNKPSPSGAPQTSAVNTPTVADWKALSETQPGTVLLKSFRDMLYLPVISPDGNWALVLKHTSGGIGMRTEMVAYRRVNGKLVEPRSPNITDISGLSMPTFYEDKATGKLMVFITHIKSGKPTAKRYFFDSGELKDGEPVLTDDVAPHVIAVDPQGRFAVIKTETVSRWSNTDFGYYVQEMQPDGSLKGKRTRIELPSDFSSLGFPPDFVPEKTKILDVFLDPDGKRLYVNFWNTNDAFRENRYLIRYTVQDDLGMSLDEEARFYPSAEVDIEDKVYVVKQYTVSPNGQIFVSLKASDGSIRWGALDGGRIRLLDLKAKDLAMTPDGRQLLYIGLGPDADGNDIMALDIPESRPTQAREDSQTVTQREVPGGADQTLWKELFELLAQLFSRMAGAPAEAAEQAAVSTQDEFSPQEAQLGGVAAVGAIQGPDGTPYTGSPLSFSPDGAEAVAGDGTLYSLDAGNMRLTGNHPALTNHIFSATPFSAAFAPSLRGGLSRVYFLAKHIGNNRIVELQENRGNVPVQPYSMLEDSFPLFNGNNKILSVFHFNPGWNRAVIWLETNANGVRLSSELFLVGVEGTDEPLIADAYEALIMEGEPLPGSDELCEKILGAYGFNPHDGRFYVRVKSANGDRILAYRYNDDDKSLDPDPIEIARNSAKIDSYASAGIDRSWDLGDESETGVAFLPDGSVVVFDRQGGVVLRVAETGEDFAEAVIVREFFFSLRDYLQQNKAARLTVGNVLQAANIRTPSLDDEVLQFVLLYLIDPGVQQQIGSDFAEVLEKLFEKAVHSQKFSPSRIIKLIERLKKCTFEKVDEQAQAMQSLSSMSGGRYRVEPLVGGRQMLVSVDDLLKNKDRLSIVADQDGNRYWFDMSGQPTDAVAALGKDVEGLICDALSLPSSWVRYEALRLLGLPARTGKADIIARLQKASPDILEALLVALFAGPERGSLMDKGAAAQTYPRLFASDSSFTLRVSRAPAAQLVRSRDRFAFATIHTLSDGSQEIIIAEQFAAALNALDDPQALLSRLIKHEIGEREFNAAVRAGRFDELKKQYPGLSARDIALLKGRPSAAYEVYHRLTRERDRDLWALADRVAGKALTDTLSAGSLAAADPRSWAFGRPLAKLLSPAAKRSVDRFAPLLSGQGAVIAGLPDAAARARAFASHGLAAVAVERGGPGARHKPVSAKAGGVAGGFPTGSVFVPVDGKNVELRIYARLLSSRRDPGTALSVRYEPLQDLTPEEATLLDAVAPAYIGQWIEGNKALQGILGVTDFRFGALVTADRAFEQERVRRAFEELRSAPDGLGYEHTVIACAQSKGRAFDPGKAAEFFDVWFEGSSDAVMQLHQIENAMKVKRSGPGFMDALATTGVKFADARAMLLQGDAYRKTADLFFLRSLPAKDDTREYAETRRAVRWAAAREKQVAGFYRLKDAASAAEAQKDIAAWLSAGMRIIIDARRADWSSDDVLVRMCETLAGRYPDMLQGVVLDDQAAPDPDMFGRLGLRRVVRVSPVALLQNPAGAAAALETARKASGDKLWLDIDDEVEIAWNEAAETIGSRLRGSLSQCLGNISLLSVPQELLALSARPDDGEPAGLALLLALKTQLRRAMQQDPRYRFKRGKSDGKSAHFKLSDEALPSLLRFIAQYRRGNASPLPDALAAFAAQADMRDPDYRAGFVRGVLEHRAAGWIDARRPFIHPAHAELYAAVMVDLQLAALDQGASPALLGDEGALRSWLGENAAVLQQSVGKQQALLDEARMTNFADRDSFNRFLLAALSRMSLEAPHPLVLAEMLRLLDLADRDEKGLIEEFRNSMRMNVMPAAARAIAGAA